MTTTPLSPLQLKNHQFTNLRIKCIQGGTGKVVPKLTPSIWYDQVAQAPNEWRIVLTLAITSEDPEKPFLYEADIEIQGTFEVSEAYPEEKKGQLALVNGLSLLYSASREIFLTITARSAYGLVNLPTLSFVKLAEEELAKKPARGKQPPADAGQPEKQ